MDGLIEKLIIRNDKETPATVRRFCKLACEAHYRSEYEFNLNPHVFSPVTRDSPAECNVVALNGKTIFHSLKEALSVHGIGHQSSETFVLDYDDMDGNEFSRLFTFTRTLLGGTIAITPGHVCVRGKANAEQPQEQELDDLRRTMELAGRFESEQENARSYRAKYERCVEYSGSIEAKLSAWPAVSAINTASNQLEECLRQLEHLLNSAERGVGNELLTPLMKSPIHRDVYPIGEGPYQDLHYRIHLWRFQEEFAKAKRLLPEYPLVELKTLPARSEIGGRELLNLLSGSKVKLDNYAAGLLASRLTTDIMSSIDRT